MVDKIQLTKLNSYEPSGSDILSDENEDDEKNKEAHKSEEKKLN